MESGKNRQRGVVMLSVLGVLGLMSLMTLHSARQTQWLAQTAQHLARQQDSYLYQSEVLAALYRFDLTAVVGDPGGRSCYRVNDRSCVCVVPETSAAATWRFELWSDEDPDRALISGWLRGGGQPAHQVVAVSQGKPAGHCRSVT